MQRFDPYPPPLPKLPLLNLSRSLPLFIAAALSAILLVSLLVPTSASAAECDALDDPAAFAEAGRIDFDDLAISTIVTDHYTADYGVTFTRTELIRALVYRVPSAEDPPPSPPHVLNNSATSGNSNSDIPLNIYFNEDKRAVGMWIANGAELVTATLVAYNDADEELCRRAGLPTADPFTYFYGLEDQAGRIRRITLDYGATPLNEQIDDLYFAPYIPAKPELPLVPVYLPYVAYES